MLAVASAVVIPAPAYHSPLLGPAIHGPIAKIAAPVYPAIAKYAAPVVAKVAAPEPYDPNPQYSYSYDVHVSIYSGYVNNITELFRIQTLLPTLLDLLCNFFV